METSDIVKELNEAKPMQGVASRMKSYFEEILHESSNKPVQDDRNSFRTQSTVFNVNLEQSRGQLIRGLFD